MSSVRPLPTRPSPRQRAFDREIQALAAPGLADDLGLDLGARPYDGPALAVVGCMKHLSVEGRRTLARFASDLEDAEARGLSVLRIDLVTAVADSKARA